MARLQPGVRQTCDPSWQGPGPVFAFLLLPSHNQFEIGEAHLRQTPGPPHRGNSLLVDAERAFGVRVPPAGGLVDEAPAKFKQLLQEHTVLCQSAAKISNFKLGDHTGSDEWRRANIHQERRRATNRGVRRGNAPVGMPGFFPPPKYLRADGVIR